MSGAERDNGPGGVDYFADLAIYPPPAVNREPVGDPQVSSGRAHTIRFATDVTRGRARLYVIECGCGWATALHPTQGAAQAAYRKHAQQVPA